jgi:hypothetical protein
MLWDVRLGGELMRACRQLAAVRKAMGERPAADRDAGAAEGVGEVDGAREFEDVEEFEGVSEFEGVDGFDGAADGGRPEPRPDGVGPADAGADGAEAGLPEAEGGSREAEAGSREVVQLDARPLTLTLSPGYGGEGTGGGPRTSDGPSEPDESLGSHGLFAPDVSRRSAVAASAEPTHCSAAGRASEPSCMTARGSDQQVAVPMRQVIVPSPPRRFDGGRPPRPWTAAVGNDWRPTGAGGG